MITYEEFEEMAQGIIEGVPQEFFQGLNGGVHLKPEKRLHPVSKENAPVYIMGLYTKSDVLGCHIDLFYGSFATTYGVFPREHQEKALRDILLHELRHHIELLCGMQDLIYKDEEQLNRIINNEDGGNDL